MTSIQDKPYSHDRWNESDIAIIHNHLANIASLPQVKTILEIGSHDGSGSTSAIVRGMSHNPSNPFLYCLETNPERFSLLKRRFYGNPNVMCLRAAGTHWTQFYKPDPSIYSGSDIEFCQRELQKYKEEISKNFIPQNGIEFARSTAEVDVFDFVYLDSGMFSADYELALVYGAKFIALDDVDDIKNRRTHARLAADPLYDEVVREYVCNVFSVFQKK